MAFDAGGWLEKFPVREHYLYLDHAALAPLPAPVAEVMRERISQQEATGYLEGEGRTRDVLTCRHLGARLLGCTEEDVTIVSSTSDGLSTIALGLGLGPGDEVLVGEEEFISNVAPWLNLERHGVTVTRYPQPGGRVDPEVVASHAGPSTRVLAVSWVAFHTGWVAPLAQLGRICRDRDMVLVVDAIQGLGVLPMDMTTLGADAVVADGHKWLLGPEGAGLLGTSPSLRARLQPPAAGWCNVQRTRGEFTLHQLSFLEDGRRFEAGSLNRIGIAGLAAALDLITEAGTEMVQARVEMLHRLLARILISHGWSVISPGPGQPVAGIVAARHPTVPAHEVVTKLRERHVICSARQGNVRFSPHFYTTRGEIEAFEKILGKVGL